MYHHETREAQEIREAWNARTTGFDAVVEEPAKVSRIELPTPAGTVLLSLGDLSAMPPTDAAEGGGLEGLEPTPSRLSFTSAPMYLLGGMLKKGVGLPKHDSSSMRRRKRKGSESSDISSGPSDAGTAGTADGPSDAGAAHSQRPATRPSMLVSSLGLGVGEDAEEQIPPLTAEDAKARATRTAQLVELSYQSQSMDAANLSA